MKKKNMKKKENESERKICIMVKKHGIWKGYYPRSDYHKRKNNDNLQDLLDKAFLNFYREYKSRQKILIKNNDKLLTKELLYICAF